MNILPGTLVGMEGAWARVRFAGGAEVETAAGDVRMYPGAAVTVAVAPADLRILATPGAGGLTGTAAGAECRNGMTLVRVDVAGVDATVWGACPACGPLPAPGSHVALVFDPASGRLTAREGSPPMRRGPDGPYLVDARSR